jgi:hypothetical protein
VFIFTGFQIKRLFFFSSREGRFFAHCIAISPPFWLAFIFSIVLRVFPYVCGPSQVGAAVKAEQVLGEEMLQRASKQADERLARMVRSSSS